MKTRKIHIIIISLLFLILLNFPNNKIAFAEQNLQYARIKNSNVFLYKSAKSEDSIENIYFALPKTYFVNLLNIENENFYKAKYLNTTGFIKKSAVDCIEGIPVNPYASQLSCRIFAKQGLKLRSSPEVTGGIFNQITTLPYLETNIQIYGTIEGEEATPQRGNIWYYIKYNDSNNEPQNGYIYAGYCDLVTTPTQNTEVFKVISEPVFENVNNPTNNNTNINQLASMSTTTQVLIIVGVCLPALFIIYILFKPSKIMVKTQQNKKKRIKKKKYKGDYYEYD